MQCGCNAPFFGPSLSRTCYGSFVLFMSILDTLTRNNCKVSEICERITPEQQPEKEYDFIVVGGGSAGSVVASRLSEISQWKVLLIEAGVDEPPGTQIPSMMNNFHGSSIDWNFKTQAQKKACLGYPEQRCSWPRGKVLGGCGVINGMMYMRGLPEDYDNWERMGNRNWGYRDVLEFFKLSEGNTEIGLVSREEHGTDGPMTTGRFLQRPELADDMLRAAVEAGFLVVDDLNAPPFRGFTVAQANQRNGTRLSTARAYLRPARSRTNLHIMLNSTATKILLTQKRASEVQFSFNNRSFSIKAKKEVVLCAGALNSPQLLLLSGIGAKHTIHKVHLKQLHSLPGVGKNLQNHVSFNVNFQMRLEPAVNDLDWVSADKYFESRESLLASTGMSQVTGRVATKYAQESLPDLQIFFNGYLANCSRFGLVGEKQCVQNKNICRVFSISPVTIRPRSRGYIKLSSKNSSSPPLMNPKYFTAIEDLKILVEGVRVAQRLANATVLAKNYGVEIIQQEYGNCFKKYTYDSDEFWMCAIKFSTAPENHQCCSCKMGPTSDSSAVVDSELQVYGIDGLRVVDASIMPTVVSGNLQATVVMIAERGAAFIKKKWLDG